MGVVVVRRQHVLPMKAGHPWVFAQAIVRVEGSPEPGDVVEVRDSSSSFVGLGYYSPGSSIPVRLLVTRTGVPLDDALLGERLAAAVKLRRELGLPNEGTTGYRLINAEGDNLPGLVVDVYGEALVLRFATVGMRRRAELICDTLASLVKPTAMIEAAGDESQAREGLRPQGGVLRGTGGPLFEFRENGLGFVAQLPGGQKTGFYFDQRENRARVAGLSTGRRVLDLYCYTGPFAILAKKAGAAEVLAVDSSPVALLGAEEHASRNGLRGQIKFLRSDARKMLPQLAGSLDPADRFDLIVLDPPKLMTSNRSKEDARRAYRWLNAMALRCVARGGMLASCCCSGRMPLEEFLRVLGLASQDSRRDATVLEVRGAGPDHPVPPAFEQGRYLKCVLLKVEA